MTAPTAAAMTAVLSTHTGHAAAAATSRAQGRWTAGRVWAYLGIVLGAVVSVAANVAHSYVRPPDLTTATAWTPETGAVLGATFWPISLLITTEIMVRTSWPPGRAWLLLRFLGLLPVAGVAAVVSYLHLHGLLQHYHEAPLTCLIAPFSVDGLMVMASSALVAGNATGSADTPQSGGLPAPDDRDTVASAAAIRSEGPGSRGAPIPPPGPHPSASPTDLDAMSATPPDTGHRAADGTCEACRTRPATTTWSRPTAGQPFRLCGTCAAALSGHPGDHPTGTFVSLSAPLSATGGQTRSEPVRMSTGQAVAWMRSDDPDLTTADIADRLGVTARTVRRHLATHRATTAPTDRHPDSRDTSHPGDSADTAPFPA